MKAFWFLRVCLALMTVATSGAAFAYEMKHDYYNRFRSPYKYNLYLAQQVNTAQSDVPIASGDETKTHRFTGQGLQLAAGMEHFRFIQTGAFFSTTQLQNPDNARNELRLVDSGFDAKMVMSTPVVNVLVGGAAVYTRAHLSSEGERIALNGAGYRGIFEMSYFASTQVSLVLSGSHTVTNFAGKNSKGENIKPVGTTSRLGVGLTVWL